MDRPDHAVILSDRHTRGAHAPACEGSPVTTDAGRRVRFRRANVIQDPTLRPHGQSIYLHYSTSIDILPRLKPWDSP